jgi:hypothetical protein
MRGTFLPAALALGLGLAAVSPAGAAVTATAAPDRKELYLGQVLVVTVVVKDAAGLPTVRPDAVSACTITPLGPGQRTGSDRTDGARLSGAVLGLVNRLTSQLDSAPDSKEKAQAQAQAADVVKDLKELRRGGYVFYFRVQPEKPGTLTVPAFRVLAEGEEATTKPFEIKVEPSGPAPWLHLEWALSNPRPRVGEAVQLLVDVRMERRDTSLEGRKFLHLPLRNILLFVPEERRLPGVKFHKTLEEVAREHAPKGKVGFRVKGLPEEVLFDQIAEIPGERPAWFRYRLPLPVTFTRAGTVELPPVWGVGEVYVPLLQEAPGTANKPAAPAAEWLPFADTGEALRVEVVGR